MEVYFVMLCFETRHSEIEDWWMNKLGILLKDSIQNNYNCDRRFLLYSVPSIHGAGFSMFYYSDFIRFLKRINEPIFNMLEVSSHFVKGYKGTKEWLIILRKSKWSKVEITYCVISIFFNNVKSSLLMRPLVEFHFVLRRDFNYRKI